MRTFLLRVFFIASPLLAWQLIELVFLPATFFTFRPWEAATVRNDALFTGPFYPNQRLEMYAAGDLDPRGPRDRYVRFHTDKLGYRNPEHYLPDIRYDFLLVGDSNFAGANVDDADTLRAVLEHTYNKKTYSYASGWPACQAFVNDDRISANMPRFIVLDFRPEDVLHGRYAAWPASSKLNDSQRGRLGVALSGWDAWLFANTGDDFRILYDRAHAQLGYNFLRSRLLLTKRKRDPQLTIAEAERNFLAVVESLTAFRKNLQSRGTDLIVLLMPLPYPPGVGDLIAVHLGPSVPMVHWQKGSPYASDATTSAWFEERDSHWRASSIATAAKRIVEVSEGL